MIPAEELVRRYQDVMVKEIVSHGIRWCSNILAELLSNYGHKLSKENRDTLKQASDSLQRSQLRL